MSAGEWYPNQFGAWAPHGACPGCGRCRHCGQPAQAAPWPYFVPYPVPVYPTPYVPTVQPTWIIDMTPWTPPEPVTCTAGTITIGGAS
jgi:hypothetical protein